MLIKLTITRIIDAPDGATHYAGDILDEPAWYKRTVNETGTFDGWSVYRSGDWYLDSWYHPTPHWVEPIADTPAMAMEILP